MEWLNQNEILVGTNNGQIFKIDIFENKVQQLESFDYVSIFSILALDSKNFLAALDSGEVYHFQEFDNIWKNSLAFKGIRQSAVHLSKNNQFIVCSFS